MAELKDLLVKNEKIPHFLAYVRDDKIRHFKDQKYKRPDRVSSL